MEAGASEFMVSYESTATAKDIELYQSMIGSLMYLSTQTRPDIAYSMSVLSRFLTNPSPAHIEAAKRVMRYMKGTAGYGISYGSGTISPNLHRYSNADYAGYKETRRSTSGYVFFLAGGPFSWRSRRQNTITLSSTEAEYYALSHAAREAAWLRLLFEGLYCIDSKYVKIRIYGDNQSSLALSENPEYHQRTKHIEVQHHYIREQVGDGKVDLFFVPTLDMSADGLTKALKAPAFKRFMKQVNLYEVVSSRC